MPLLLAGPSLVWTLYGDSVPTKISVAPLFTARPITSHWPSVCIALMPGGSEVRNIFSTCPQDLFLSLGQSLVSPTLSLDLSRAFDSACFASFFCDVPLEIKHRATQPSWWNPPCLGMWIRLNWQSCQSISSPFSRADVVPSYTASSCCSFAHGVTLFLKTTGPVALSFPAV